MIFNPPSLQVIQQQVGETMSNITLKRTELVWSQEEKYPALSWMILS